MEAGSSKQKVVKLSDRDVIRDIEREARIADRSMAGQVEHWVKLGQAAEAILGTSEIRTLKESLQGAASRKVSLEGVKEKILSVLGRPMSDLERVSVQARVLSPGVPVFQADPADPRGVIRIDPDGTRVAGRIRDGQFVPAQPRRRKAS